MGKSYLNELSDEKLLVLLKKGDVASYKEIYNRYHAALYIHAFKRVQDKEECRDIIQNLFINLWQKKENLDISENLSGYLYKAVRNSIFNLISKNKIQTKYIDSIQKFSKNWDSSTDFLIRQNQLLQIIQKEIELLPPRTREIFKLSRFEYFSHKEIGERLEISEQTVKSSVNNALKILRVKLGSKFTLFL